MKVSEMDIDRNRKVHFHIKHLYHSAEHCGREKNLYFLIQKYHAIPDKNALNFILNRILTFIFNRKLLQLYFSVLYH
ncbi:hypothetical protein CN354_19270 [Bacillus cereus]|nr:hypothetical protein CN354_19270 [Bacillus cereus]